MPNPIRVWQLVLMLSILLSISRNVISQGGRSNFLFKRECLDFLFVEEVAFMQRSFLNYLTIVFALYSSIGAKTVHSQILPSFNCFYLVLTKKSTHIETFIFLML